jgi:hypothetical protein
MGMKKRVCPHCKQEFSPNRFHPEQVVCSFPPCQRQRRTEYHRKKIAADPDYRQLCANSRTYWKEKNPDYLKQHRTQRKNANIVADKNGSAIEELLRLFGHIKNTSARNTSALTVTRCLVEMFWVAPADASVATNNLATAKVIVFQGDLKSAG